MSKLLLDENPLIVMPQLAVRIGLNEAIILQQVHYWLEINRKANKNFKDNEFWVYNTYEEWKVNFPFWSESTIKRSISKLEKSNLLITGNYNKLKIDRTKWYRINYKTLENLTNKPLCQNDTSNNSNCTVQDFNLTRPLPETTTETTTKNTNYKEHKCSDYKVVETTTRLSFSEIIKTNTFTGHKKYIEAKEKVVDMYFEQYQNYTGYSKHFEVKSKQWENINEALDYSFEFAEINKLNVKKIFTELLDVNFSTENKKGYDSLQGFLSIGRIKYLLYKLEYLDVTEVFDITGQFDETL